MISTFQQVFSIGLGLVHRMTDSINSIFRCTFGIGVLLYDKNPTVVELPNALWGRITPCPADISALRSDGIHYVGFDTYFFSCHAAAVLARGKYPLLRKCPVVLCLSDKQYEGVKMYLLPKRSPLMRIEVQQRLAETGLASLLKTNMFYVKERSMIALSAFFRVSNIAVALGHRQKQIAVYIDIFLGIGLPILVMILHYTVPPHRFDIYEGYGCQSSIWPSIPSIFAVSLWPVVLSLAAAVYGIIAIQFFLSRRLHFQTLLKSSKSGLDNRHYVRLMALASVDILIGLPLTLFSLIENISWLQPYESWSVVHYGWSRIDQYYAGQALGNAKDVASVLLPKWHTPLLSILFFLFFGVSIDSINEYVRWIDWIKSKFGFISIGNKKSHDSLPSFVPKLGSTVAKPIGGDWKERSTTEESMVEMNYLPESPTPRDHSRRGINQGVSVDIRVEREVV